MQTAVSTYMNSQQMPKDSNNIFGFAEQFSMCFFVLQSKNVVSVDL